jgi:hypothetical protein
MSAEDEQATQSAATAAAAAQVFANDRRMMMLQEPASQRDLLLAGRFNHFLPEQNSPVLQYANYPLVLSSSIPPPAQQPSQFRHGAPMADTQAMLFDGRLQVQALLLLQQQQQAVQREATENARILAEAQRLTNLKNNLDPRFLENMGPRLPCHNLPFLNTIAPRYPILPSSHFAEQDNDMDPKETGTHMEDTKKLRAKNMEEQALNFLGSTNRAAKNGLYFDASVLSDPEPEPISRRRTRGGVTEPFPEKVHRMLTDAEANGNEDILSFFPHGRAFGIHKPDRFVKEILGKYVRQSQMSSFQRQLNLCESSFCSVGSTSFE